MKNICKIYLPKVVLINAKISKEESILNIYKNNYTIKPPLKAFIIDIKIYNIIL